MKGKHESISYPGLHRYVSTEQGRDSNVIDYPGPQAREERPRARQAKKIRLGDLLVADGKITEEQLARALAKQKETGNRLGRTLVELELIGADELMQFLARKLEVPYVDLASYPVDAELVKQLPEELARRCRAILLKTDEVGLLVGMDDPTDIFAFDELTKRLSGPLTLALVKEDDLIAAHNTIYRHTTEINDFAAALTEEMAEQDEVDEAGEEVSEAPVVRLLQHMFEDALQVNASDIHIEPDENELRIRFRMDGMLHVQTTAEKRIARAVASRLKLMAGLDISEKRLPQDGRFNVRVRNKGLDIRLSTMPTQYGESVVMRLLQQSSTLLEIGQLGMPEQMAAELRDMVRSPHGAVFVTGPTGSGKTTTLYAALAELNSTTKKIITVEDPVEYRLKGINQVQVNQKIDLSFARVLRTILRQDPDIVLVGEMRDQETIEIGLRAALTGHLVLSSLHTNDAASTFSRLMDMGAEPFLIASTLRGVVAQRLVRRVCDNCAEPDPEASGLRKALEKEFGERLAGVAFRKGKGCSRCNKQGYQGRIGVYEVLAMTDELTNAVHTGNTSAINEIVRVQQRGRSLKDSALALAAKGRTSAEEVIRVTYGMHG